MAALEMGLKFQTTPGLPSTSRLVFYLGLLSQGLSCISPIAAARLEQLAPSPRLLAGCAPVPAQGLSHAPRPVAVAPVNLRGLVVPLLVQHVYWTVFFLCVCERDFR